MLIFRVETRYGIHDADSLREAKANSKPSDHIQAVAPDGLTILSRVVRNPQHHRGQLESVKNSVSIAKSKLGAHELCATTNQLLT